MWKNWVLLAHWFHCLELILIIIKIRDYLTFRIVNWRYLYWLTYQITHFNHSMTDLISNSLILIIPYQYFISLSMAKEGIMLGLCPFSSMSHLTDLSKIFGSSLFLVYFIVSEFSNYPFWIRIDKWLFIFGVHSKI